MLTRAGRILRIGLESAGLVAAGGSSALASLLALGHGLTLHLVSMSTRVHLLVLSSRAFGLAGLGGFVGGGVVAVHVGLVWKRVG